MVQRVLLVLLALAVGAVGYNVGVGIADMTGPAVEIVFMGYAQTSQVGDGIHMRQWARAFVVEDEGKHVAFVSMDGGMGSDLVNKRVVEALQVKLPGVYTYDNVCISGTHTHSTPGGFHQYVMLEVPSLGFVKESIDSMVTGVTNAIVKAHQALAPGSIKYAHGEKLFGANINRSPTSYLLNPQAERDEYAAQGDTDKGMLLLRFDAADGTPLGQVNWFAVHGTSLNNTNTLVSGDNRGYASYLFEREMNGKDALPGKGKFVAAFASTNLGDVSPNTNGAKCIDTGLPCDKIHSTCGGKEEKCVAFGPGKNAQGQSDMYESMKIIGRKQFDYAKELFAQAKTEVAGPVDYRHSFIKFGGLPVTLDDGTEVKTCKAALGNAFAAGTTDGCGMFDFTQGTNTSNIFWNTVGGLLSEPTKEEKACQHPKPILLNTNGMTFPYAWDASSLPIQIFRIGQLVITAPPGELTTMAGRRFRKALKETYRASFKSEGIAEPVVTIAGLSNSYMQYMTTFEEFQAQRYEAASTLYGPHQLTAFTQEFKRIANDMISKRNSTSGAPPADTTKQQLSFVPGVILDFAPIGKKFGQALTKPNTWYPTEDTVSVEFQSGNPRNNVRLESSFLTVDLQQGSTWKTVATDGNPETTFRWKDTKLSLGAESHVFIDWVIPTDAEEGTYRICHHGDRKSVTSALKVVPYTGCSDSFQVGGAPPPPPQPACPVCKCDGPTIWPFSGCNVACGASCGGKCCCIAGEGKCPSNKDFFV